MTPSSPEPVTPETAFNLRRREILKLLPAAAVAALVPGILAAAVEEPLTSEQAATAYNNYYEFGFGKGDPARFVTAQADQDAWVISIDGLVETPLNLPLHEATRHFAVRRVVRRMRCVEGWSMNIPWNGFALGELLRLARPGQKARFVAFTSAADPARMPEVRKKSFPFPYREGLRLDEAMHPLAFLAIGAYDKDLLPQNGAPLRLVLPWKYGFKYAKAITKITLTAEQPKTTWNDYAPQEYGFYANVNPAVPHPRWQQDEEDFIGPEGVDRPERRPTLLFNGYDEVADLYAGMDLRRLY